MLELKNIKKDYPAGDGIVEALKGIDLQFRTNEFVSILGPSGCGKTTLLNIIGGLDQYTSGDLVINGTSTKDFKDRDWDTYRNHSIGFVFQSYNLIPHQTVLQNVELALTLTGVSKKERRERAKHALEQVGLGNQLSKRPSQMSGGQMQRVAIARALVNNPDIILADEPTGALDTETSVQVMNILKEISKDKLIVMVTHNPDLAEEYSTRIIRMLDGVLKEDTRPLSEEELAAEKKTQEEAKAAKGKKEKKPSMSFATAFSLSLKNLISKRGRTLLTSFAGSIGIIGIALIFAVSRGMTAYIDMVQENTLSSYPLTIESTAVDASSLMMSFMGTARNENVHENDAVYVKPVVYDTIDALTKIETSENDLKSFKKYIEAERAKEESESGLREAISGIQYSYNLDLLVYTKNIDGDIIASDIEDMLSDMMVRYMGMDQNTADNSSAMMGMNPMANMMTGGMQLWDEMLPGDNGKPVSDLLEKQYDVVYGSWPNSYNEIVLVLDENNELADMTLYALGLESKDTIDKTMQAAVNGEEIVVDNDKHWSYEEICALEYKVILNSSCYSYDKNTGMYTDLRDTEAGLKYLYDNAVPLKVTGIIRPNPDADTTMLGGSIAYTSLLTEYVIRESRESASVQAQLDNPSVDIFTNLPFEENTGSLTSEVKEKAFRDYIAELDESGKAEAYIKIMSIPTKEQLEASVTQAMTGLDRAAMETTMSQVLAAQVGMSEEEITGYLTAMSDEEIAEYYSQMVAEQVKMQFAAQVQQQMAAMSVQELAMGLDYAAAGYTTEQCARYYEEVLEFSDSSYERNLRELGYLDLEEPSRINLYASSFENKDVIEDAITRYNDSVEEASKIKYTDYVGIMMSSVTSIINTITYVLIAFVAISLVVSSIMIGVITLISVQERTKEIGILRAMGASKRDVSSMFNAETIIIGFAAGFLGVAVTYLLCIPINAVIHHLTGINNLNAQLPIEVAAILVAISMLLTVFSGVIPSRSAAKKDPVVALRTE